MRKKSNPQSIILGCESIMVMAGIVFASALLMQTVPPSFALGDANPLSGTNWRLLEFQSMDDAIGKIIPDDPSRYTIQFNDDGTVNMRLNCNRANGRWQVKPVCDGTSGSFKITELTTTKALCSPPGLDESIAAQAEYIRSYLIKEGKLYLSLMADGGIYAWEPITSMSDTETAPQPGNK